MRDRVKRQAPLFALVTGAVLGLALCGLAPPVRAHVELVPTLVNRYVTLAARGERLHVQLALLWGEVPALEERRRMDLDGDGRLDDGEVNRARRAFTSQVRELVALRLDGEPVRLSPSAAISLSGKERVTTAPLLLELTAVVDLPEASRRVEVALGPDLPRMGESEIVLELGPEWSLESSEQPPGRPLPSAEARFKFASARRGDDQSRELAFILRHQPGGRRGDPRLTALGVGIAVVVLAAILLAAWRLRGQPPQERK